MRVSSGNSYVAIHGLVKHMTRKAVLFSLTGSRREVWIPMSVISEEDLAGTDVGVIGEINVAEWFYTREIE